jgi:plasmid stabilization system protein ParE
VKAGRNQPAQAECRASPQTGDAAVTFRGRLTRDAEADLGRLFDFVVQRKIGRKGGDLERAEEARAAIRAGLVTLKSSPFTCRKTGPSSFVRELVIALDRSGCVAFFEIVDTDDVVVAAVRCQLEEDCH